MDRDRSTVEILESLQDLFDKADKADKAKDLEGKSDAVRLAQSIGTGIGSYCTTAEEMGAACDALTSSQLKQPFLISASRIVHDPRNKDSSIAINIGPVIKAQISSLQS